MAAQEKVCRDELAVIASRNNETHANCQISQENRISLNLVYYWWDDSYSSCTLLLSYLIFVWVRHGRENHWWDVQDTSFELMSVPGISPRFLPVFLPLPFTVWPFHLLSFFQSKITYCFFPALHVDSFRRLLSYYCNAQRFTICLFNISQT